MARSNPKPEHSGSFPIREDRRVKFEVHVAGVCVRPTNDHWEVLIAQRTGERHLYPGKWECGGGRLNDGESFNDAIRRQAFEEFGIEVEPLELLETYEIHVPGKKRVIAGLRFLCVASDGVVRLNEREFTSFKWVTFPVPSDLDWIDGVKRILDDLETELLKRKAPDSQRGPASLNSRAVN
jgi:8-oxo-dGTP pyrophosphatase MutT (NUDIX family)